LVLAENNSNVKIIPASQANSIQGSTYIDAFLLSNENRPSFPVKQFYFLQTKNNPARRPEGTTGGEQFTKSAMFCRIRLGTIACRRISTPFLLSAAARHCQVDKIVGSGSV
jgi:hypothetical protein